MDSPEQLMPLVRDLSVLGCLVIAVRWLADKFSSAQREIVDLLRGVIADNTRALSEVREVMKSCHDRHGVPPLSAPNPAPLPPAHEHYPQPL